MQQQAPDLKIDLLSESSEANSPYSPSRSLTGLAIIKSNCGILLPKLFWPSVRKNCSSDREKLLEFKAEGREFAKILTSLEQFVQTVKGQI